MAGAERAPEPRRRVLRRALGIIVCGLPVLLAVACALWPRAVPAPREATGWALVTLPVLIAGLNLYLAYLRPWRHRRQGGSPTDLRHVSGLPLVGTLFAVGACIAAFGSATVGGLALVATLADPDGVPWIPIRTWHDASLWDA